MLCVVLALGYVVHEPVLRGMGRYLIDDEPPATADAIVVLAGSVPDRILEAVALYRDGFAPRIVLSRGRNPAGYRHLRAMGIRIPRLFELNRSVAEQLGVPSDAIAEVGGAEGSTYDEAQQVLRYVRQHGYAVIFVVTSKHHSRRAAIIYRHLAGPDIRVISRPSRYDNFDPDRWWHSRTFRRRAIIEYEKLVVFLLLERWHLAPVAAEETT